MLVSGAPNAAVQAQPSDGHKNKNIYEAKSTKLLITLLVLPPVFLWTQVI